MKQNGYYGERAANASLAVRSHAFVSRQKDQSIMAITSASIPEIYRETTLLPRENALVFTLSTGDSFDRELYLNGSANPIVNSVPQGQFSFLDLRQEAQLRLNSAIDMMQFYLPVDCLNAIADDAGRPRIKELALPSGVVTDDPVIRLLATALIPCFQKPEEVSRLFIDHMTRAFAAHVSHTYGNMLSEPRTARGGLAPWQEKRIREMLDANLSGDVSLDDLAAECRLSTRHLSRAFRQTMGMPPHRWLLLHRVEKAKSILANPRLPLSDIASACGFADQSHFTRVFTQMSGVSPGAWRRQMRTDAYLPSD